MQLRNKGVAAVVLVTALGVNGCRRQVVVSPGTPTVGTAVPTPQAYHQDAGVTLAVPQTKFFKGSIGSSLGLEMRLTRDGDQVNGNYLYQKVGTKINLKGTLDKDNNLNLEEFDNAGKQTGLFKGTWSTDADGVASVAGFWSKPGGDKRTAFSLHEEPIEFTAGVELTSKQIKEANKKSNYQIQVQYPQTTGSTDPRFEKFNQEIKGLVSRRVAEFKKDTVAAAEEVTTEATAEETSSTGSSLDISYDIALAKDDLISVKFDLGSYSAGAAHPNANSETVNYDLKTGKALKLADLFMPGAKYLQTISTYCIKDLQRQSKSSGAILDDETLRNGASPQAKNYQSWNITKKGLQIHFDPYQVGPYAAGPQTVVVPYSVLKDIIRLDGPLLQFVK